MKHTLHKPHVMGALMGAMILWMLHSQIASGSGWALVPVMLFVGAHVLIAIVLAGLTVLGIRRLPKIAQRMDRLHWPTKAHVYRMLCAALATALGLHFLLHGLSH